MLNELKKMVCECMSNKLKLEEIQQSRVLSEVIEKINEFKQAESTSKTAQLWLQYLHAVEIFLRFVKAERCSDWALHLQSVREMMPYFAAAGHHLYTKSSYLYLQTMTQLHVKHPDVQKKFEDGFHSIRRSDRFWTGLSSDLVIEQALM